MSANALKQQLIQAIQHAQAGQTQKAFPLFQTVLKNDPNNTAALFFYGQALVTAEKYDDAQEHLEKALKNKPGWADAASVLANVYFKQKNYKAALGAIDTAIAAQNDNASFFALKALILADDGNPYEGLKWAKKAVKTDPGMKQGYVNMGICLHHLEQYKEAIDSFQKATAIDPAYALAHRNLSNTVLALGKKTQWPSESFDLFTHIVNEAIKHCPEDGNVWTIKAMITGHSLGMWDEALPAFEKALALNPGADYLHSDYLMGMHYADDIPREKIFKAHQDWEKSYTANLQIKPRDSFENDKSPHRKLRIGLISANFCRGPVGFMTLRALEALPADQYEFYCYADMTENRYDPYCEAYQKLSEKWVDIYKKKPDEISRHILEDKLDILIDLSGHSEAGNSLRLVARRLAPVQIKWVGGLFNTTGLKQMDWLIADDVQIPHGDEKWYTEKIYRMPDNYICYEPVHEPDISPLPAKRNGYVTFGNLNNLTKTNHGSIALWAKILKEVKNSKILMRTQRLDAAIVQKKLFDGFSRYGIGPDRIILKPGCGHLEFIKTYNEIDIALDPHPYSGGLTTCEALWMGVPKITYPGETFAGRHAATHISTVGLEDWIVDSKEAYIEKAVYWAQNLDELSALRDGLRDKVKASPLIDPKRYAQNLDKALRHMWRDWAEN